MDNETKEKVQTIIEKIEIRFKKIEKELDEIDLEDDYHLDYTTLADIAEDLIIDYHHTIDWVIKDLNEIKQITEGEK